MPEFAKFQCENAGKNFALFCANGEHWSFLFTYPLTLYSKLIYVFSTIQWLILNLKNCTETILYGNQVIMFHSKLNKSLKDAILTENDDVINLKFWNKFLRNANKPKQSTNYNLGGHSASLDMSLASVSAKKIFSLIFNAEWRHKLKSSCAFPEHQNFFCKNWSISFFGVIQQEKPFAASLFWKVFFWTTLMSLTQ